MLKMKKWRNEKAQRPRENKISAQLQQKLKQRFANEMAESTGSAAQEVVFQSS
jgi:hypothetical protein